MVFARYSQLAKKLQFKNVQIGNITNAISNGRALDTLLATLEKFEQERDDVARHLQQVEDEIKLSKFDRPTANQIQKVWSRLIEIWEEAEEDERAEIMQGLVQEVVVHEKSRVSLVLNAIPEVHDSKFVITEKMGAGTGFVSDLERENLPVSTVQWVYTPAKQGTREMRRVGIT